MTVAALLVQVVQAAEQQQGQLEQLFEPLARERVGEGEKAWLLKKDLPMFSPSSGLRPPSP